MRSRAAGPARGLTVLALVGLCAASACRSPRTSGDAPPPPPPEEPVTPDDPDREAWLPDHCWRVESPTAPIAYDCDDGSSFTLREAIDGATAPQLLEAQWHEALSLLEMAGAAIGDTLERTCVFGALDAPCLVIEATAGGRRGRTVLVAVDDGDALLAVDCVDLTAGPGLPAVCARFLKVRDP